MKKTPIAFAPFKKGVFVITETETWVVRKRSSWIARLLGKLRASSAP